MAHKIDGSQYNTKPDERQEPESDHRRVQDHLVGAAGGEEWPGGWWAEGVHLLIFTDDVSFSRTDDEHHDEFISRDPAHTEDILSLPQSR